MIDSDLNKGTLIVVHCWSGDTDRIRQMLPLWTQHERPVLFLSPEDAPMRLDLEIDNNPQYDGQRRLITCRWAGGNGWIGTQVPHRLLKHWRIALEYQADWFFINEWDSFCTTPELPSYLFEDEDMFWSIEVDETWVVNDVTSGIRASFPYFMSRKMLRKLVAFGEEIIDDVTAGPDLPLYGNMSPDGFTMHLIRNLGVAHKPYADCLDSRQFPYDRTPPSIIHWHGLTKPSEALITAGFVGVEEE